MTAALCPLQCTPASYVQRCKRDYHMKQVVGSFINYITTYGMQ